MSYYRIVIPSYHRDNIIQTHTLAYLERNNIDPNIVFIFIVEEDFELYDKIPKRLFNKLIIGEKGIVYQREFIENYFEPGSKIISFDDDIKDLLFTVEQYENLDTFFNLCFDTCIKEKSFIFGLYPVGNPFFANKNKLYSTHLTYICSAVFGYINRGNNAFGILSGQNNENPKCVITRDNGNKEDVERSIKYFLEDGKVVRFNTVCIKTKYYNTVGGLGLLCDRIAPMKLYSELLYKEYPDITKIKIRKNGLYELILNDHSRQTLR